MLAKDDATAMRQPSSAPASSTGISQHQDEPAGLSEVTIAMDISEGLSDVLAEGAATTASSSFADSDIADEPSEIQHVLSPSRRPTSTLEGDASAVLPMHNPATPRTARHTMPQQAEDTPEKAFLRHEVRRYSQLQTATKKKIKTLQQSRRRLLHKVAHLQDVIQDLSENRILGNEDVATLQSLGGAKKDLLMRQLTRKSGAAVSPTYSPELRAFALTLHFYSPRAYRYVRATFDTCLPHPKTLCKWYQSIDGAAGFSKEALTALAMKECNYI
ncbi:uncharacterized protein LOC125945760 [Dermacentor silvarum]|uniref:uncharacterized protein LOC125945760 n=1 Tax=Dermacentor silvarum TaxID=543639 RepID=UPI002100695E|nr:uncharacterized protein LOC125945760 [Dermacentor silvarum]